MATVVQHMGHAGGDSRSGPGAGAGSRHGRDTLAEVISIRREPVRTPRPGIFGSLVTMAQGLALRAQATSARSTPHRPPSPASRPPVRPAPAPAPHDAA